MSSRFKTIAGGRNASPSAGLEPAWGSFEGQPTSDSSHPAFVLRHVLRALASDPAAMQMPHASLERLRPLVDLQRAKLAAASAGGIHSVEYRRGCATLLDGAIVGLCHVGRFAIDGEAASAIVPYAVLAAGPFARRELDGGAALDLLFLHLEDGASSVRGKRMISFLQQGLLNLGFSVQYAAASPAAVGQLAESRPEIAHCLADLRFVWGGFSLFAEICRSTPTR